MFQILTKTVVSTAVPLLVCEVPKIIERGWDSLLDWIDSEESVKKDRKKRDMTKFTQCMYDYIVEEHSLWLQNNNIRKHENKIPMDKLISSLNTVLNINKSRTAFSNIWNGKVDRETLLAGKPVEGKRKWDA